MPSVRIQVPAPALQSYVTFFYVVEVAGPLTDFLYPEWPNIRFAITGDWMVETPGFPNPTAQLSSLFGPTDRHGAVTTSGGKSIGFGLTPLGWARLIGGDASALANRVVPLDGRLGMADDELRGQLIADAAVDDAAPIARLEALLLRRLAQAPPLPPVVLAVDDALRSRPGTIGVFAARSGVPERTLQRLCPRVFGFPPKRLLRLQRFLDALGHVRSAVGDPVQASLGDTYYDQSHFYRDFRDFMGMSPRAYFSAPRRLMAAAAEAQVRAGVTLSFALPPQPV